MSSADREGNAGSTVQVLAELLAGINQGSALELPVSIRTFLKLSRCASLLDRPALLLRLFPSNVSA